ncbi:reverse transcriptase domain-containing protein [Tanacetum coccineum]
MKAITTRSGVAYKGPSIPTNPSPKKVVERETEKTTDKEQTNFQGCTAQIPPPVIPISIPEPDVPNTLPKTIPTPESKIPKNLRFDISFADALLLMPRFAPTIKSLLMNKEKLLELAKIPLNENCSAMLLKKLPEKLRDPGKFLIPSNLKDDSISPEIDHADCDPEEDICLIEKLLNNDPFQLPPMDLKQSEVTKAKYSIEEPSELELKDLPSHLEYAFLEENDKLPVIIAKGLKNDEKDALLKVLKSHKRAIAWKITDIKGIDPRFCTHKILMEDDYKPTVQSQRRVNPKIHEVIKKEVLKLLDVGMIYPISDSPWVSPVHCVPKKGGITVVANEENELIPTRLVTGWRVCIDYRKLNEATRKDHFPLPFMDQMIERLAGNEFYCFLDGFSGYFQIPIDPQDQEKTTFTCPYGTFAYRRMPFGLCNAPGTFQRCMMAIFHDMIEKTMEVFMDDFSVFGDSFDSCLSNLEKMLKRCEDTNLVLNWEKCHFMCREGIVLGHKISKSGIEVDRAKSIPMTHLLEKETPFVFSKDCIDAFQTLKKKLTEAPILVVPDWNLPFELMCDASDFAIGAVLGQRKTNHFQPIHYAQIHYTTMEKEMLAVVYAFEKFRPYLVLSKSIVYMDHSTLKYLMNKQDTKSRLLWWVLLLQEFDTTIRDKKGSENHATDHLSRLENPYKDVLENKDINEHFPLETLGKTDNGHLISCGSTFDLSRDVSPKLVTPALVKANQASTSGTLLSNTIPNPKGEMKAITTRSGVAYEGPSLPTIYLLKEKFREKLRNQNREIFQMFQDLRFDISFVDALFLMPRFAPTIRNLLMNKEKLLELAKIPLNENCSAMLLKKLPKKLGDPGKFLILCNFPGMDVCHALADLGASINLMPLSFWKKLSLPELTPTRMTLELADRSITHPKGLAEDVYVKVGKFHFPTDFVVVDFKADPRVPLILGRSFLRTGRALIDVYGEEITLWVDNEAVTFNLDQTTRYSSTNDKSVNRIDIIDAVCEEYAPELLGFSNNDSSGGNPTPTSEPLTSEFILEEIEAYLKDDSISPEIDHADCDPEGDNCLIEKMLNNDPFQLPPMDLKQGEIIKAKPSIEEPPELELKDLPSHLEYAYLEENDMLPVIIAKGLKAIENCS